MKAGFYQFAPKPGDVVYNLDTMVDAVIKHQADLVVFPELCTTGYFLSRESFIRSAGTVTANEAMESLRDVSRQTNKTIVWGMAELENGNLYNTSILVHCGRYLGKYRKTHLFHKEKDIFTPGDTGFRVFKAGGERIGMMICFDWLFPESAGTLVSKGARIIAHPANLVLPHCFKAMPVRALENRVFTITANRTGKEKDVVFRGGSMICSPGGDILARGTDETGSGYSLLDPGEADDKQITPGNNILTDRRPEFYHDSERSRHD